MSKYPKRGPVIMPVNAPWNVLRALAGDPVILSASDEMAARVQYALIRSLLLNRKRK